MSANLAMGGFKVTGLAAAASNGDAVRYEQIAGFQPLDADLTTIAGLTATTDNFMQSKASAWASRTPTQVTADLIAMVGDSGAGGTKGLVPAPGVGDAAAGKFLKADGTWAANAATAASQAEEEAASSTTVFTTPGRQQFHPGVAKCWAYATVSGGVPTLAANYNITSITDTGTGQLTITIATDFSSASWCSLSSTKFDYGTNQMTSAVQNTTQAAGSVEIDAGFTGGGRVDPNAWYFAGFGDQ